MLITMSEACCGFLGHPVKVLRNVLFPVLKMIHFTDFYTLWIDNNSELGCLPFDMKNDHVIKRLLLFN